MQIVCSGSSRATLATKSNGSSSDRVEQSSCASPQLVLQSSDRARRHARAHEPTYAGVARVVHHREDHPGELDVLEQRAAVHAVAASLGRIGRGVDLDADGVGVGGHRPEPLPARRVLGRLVPVDGRVVTMLLEEVMRKPVGEVVEVGEIDPVHHDGLPITARRIA